MKNIREKLKSERLLYDGGFGTMLQAKGLKAGKLPELVNIENPQTVTAIHEEYFRAGANIVNTNTFGANALKYDNLDEVVTAAVSCVKAAMENTGDVESDKYISLDIGPSGRMLAPLGDMTFEEAVSLFKQTVEIGVREGVDLVTIETFNDIYEAKAAVIAVKETCDLPIFVSFVYGENGRTMTGTDIKTAVSVFEALGVDAIGMNCSLGPEQMEGLADEYLKWASVPVSVVPNAGLPVVRDGVTEYDVTEDEFADSVCRMAEKGFGIVGGCCGTTPSYIKKLAERIKGLEYTYPSKKNITVVSSYSKSVVFDKRAVLIGERINPTGKKVFREALKRGDTDFILKEGIGQVEAGAEVLDVNVGIPDIDEASVLEGTVFALQGVTDTPLQIDSSDPESLERAMRIYNGKPLVNSVNGKTESMNAVFPLVKKYGGTLIALTLDENGIPETAEGRYAIAKKIVKEAARYGIDKKDIIADPLAMTVSADPCAAGVTLDAVRMIKEGLGIKTSLGVSNVSFGLPSRELLTSSFFTLALERGLDAAILNVYSAEMKKAYYTYNALCGLDSNFSDYISFSENSTFSAEEKTKKAVADENDKSLKGAIIKGLCDYAAELTGEALEKKDPLDIIKEEIVPALDTVGKGFEEKTVYLPQLLMSAEAAKSAFAEVKKKIPANDGGENGKKVVLATVKGDIHDIGKNIVKVLLENYGFEVIDLGRDVSPERVLEAVTESGAALAGLSALMTTTVPAMEETVKLIHEKAKGCLVCVGGAVLTEEYAKEIGADKYSADAMETVRYAEEVYGR